MIGQYFDVGAYSATTSKLEELKKSNSPEAIEKVAEELEAMFIYEMLKVMRKTAEVNEKEQNPLSNYNTIMDMELSKVLAQRGMGLKKYIIEALNKKRGYKNYEKIEKTEEAPKTLKPLKDDVLFKNITSGFGIRKHPVLGGYHFHKGIDIALPEGSDIRPVLEGRVVYSGFDKGYGYNIIIEHDNGLKTRYAHNMINLVKEGDVVDKNTVIGKVGKTGIATGPHLHFEVIKDDEQIDPGIFLAEKKLKF
ncbi:MAG: peptidoglycan DD-metalloendopeptidase family protein [Proteobacteria bacterium]|nr:peptidoglycan DD-metalloendopeptidase family protein [Pseudomonadota bacterium]